VPLVLLPDDEPIYVAHNAAFEMGFLAPWLPDAQWLCTYKAALRVWPEAPSHSNQVLRYWLGIRVLAGEPHRAGPDTIVTARILLKLLERASIEDMLTWTKEPPVIPRITIGEHRGKPWPHVPGDFLEWMLRKGDMDADLKWNARRELDRRVHAAHTACNEKRKTYLSLARVAVGMAETVPELERWFIGEAANRKAAGVVPETTEYANLVKACADRKRELQKQLIPTEGNNNDQHHEAIPAE